MPETATQVEALTPASIDAFMDVCRSSGCSPATIERYRRCMEQIYDLLPGDKAVRPGSLDKVRNNMLAKGCSPYTVNLMISVSTVWLDFIGHRELQASERVETRSTPHELTRREYIRLLQTAKVQGDERRYLLIKLFVLTDVTAQTLQNVTVEAVKTSQISMPNFFRDELLTYAHRNNILFGPAFLTRAGTPIMRTSVLKVIQRGCDEAIVPKEKVTPKCLNRLRETTRTAVENNLRLLVERYMENQILAEEAVYGWSN